MQYKAKEKQNHSFCRCTDCLSFLLLFPMGTRVSFESAETARDKKLQCTSMERKTDILTSISKKISNIYEFYKDEFRADRLKGPNFLL